MDTINATELAFLLEITKSNANKKIICCKERMAGNLEYTIASVTVNKDGEEESLFSENESVEIAELSKYLNVDLEFAIKNIHDTYVRSGITWSYIMDYPKPKLKCDKKGKWPKKILVPEPLRKWLSDVDQGKIYAEWRIRYLSYTTSFGIQFGN